jgi:hypothetical protein
MTPRGIPAGTRDQCNSGENEHHEHLAQRQKLHRLNRQPPITRPSV